MLQQDEWLHEYAHRYRSDKDCQTWLHQYQSLKDVCFFLVKQLLPSFAQIDNTRTALHLIYAKHLELLSLFYLKQALRLLRHHVPLLRIVA